MSRVDKIICDNCKVAKASDENILKDNVFYDNWIKQSYDNPSKPDEDFCCLDCLTEFNSADKDFIH